MQDFDRQRLNIEVERNYLTSAYDTDRRFKTRIERKIMTRTVPVLNGKTVLSVAIQIAFRQGTSLLHVLNSPFVFERWDAIGRFLKNRVQKWRNRHTWFSVAFMNDLRTAGLLPYAIMNSIKPLVKL